MNHSCTQIKMMQQGLEDALTKCSKIVINITNIPFLVKVLERVVAFQLQSFLDETEYLNQFHNLA